MVLNLVEPHVRLYCVHKWSFLVLTLPRLVVQVVHSVESILVVFWHFMSYLNLTHLASVLYMYVSLAKWMAFVEFCMLLCVISFKSSLTCRSLIMFSDNDITLHLWILCVRYQWFSRWSIICFAFYLIFTCLLCLSFVSYIVRKQICMYRSLDMS